jgi:hypothetical protein
MSGNIQIRRREEEWGKGEVRRSRNYRKSISVPPLLSPPNGMP